MKHPILTATALSLVLGGLSSNALAADSLPPEVLKQLQELTRKVNELQQKVDAAEKKQQVAAAPSQDLDQKVRIIERKLQLADEELAKQKKEAPVVIAGDKGFGLRSADGKNEIKFRGLIQEDARVFGAGIKGLYSTPTGTRAATDNILLRRARPTIEGTIDGIYDFKLTSDFGNGQSTLVDGYVGGNFLPEFKVRAGKFTPPIGLERLQSSADTKFNELALPSVFIPSRDVGIQLSGDLFSNTLNYAIGLFDGVVDGGSGDNDSNNDKEIAGRLFAQPFTNTPGALQGLGFGVGASVGNARGATGNTALTNYKTDGQENFYGYRTDTSATNTVIADGQRIRLVPQFSYYNGSLGVTGEYVNEAQEVARVNGAVFRSEDLNHDAWQLTSSWILTGEDASFKSVKPAHNFDPGKGGWGAWELVARVSELNIDDHAFTGINGVLGSADSFADPTKSAKTANNWAVGVNWYLNKVVRVSLDYDNTTFTWGGGGTAVTPQDREDERVLISRIQASF